MIGFPGPMDQTGRIAAFYSGLAPVYDAAYSTPTDKAEDWALKRLLRRAGVNAPGASVLDLGCGTGLLLRLCPERAADPSTYTGVDIAPGMIDAARLAFPKADFRQADMVEWACRREVRRIFDAVVCLWGSINYIPTGAIKDILDNALAPGGAFFLMSLAEGERPLIDHLPQDVLHYHPHLPSVLGADYKVWARPFAREWPLPAALGGLVELFGASLPLSWGRNRYVIYSGVQL